MEFVFNLTAAPSFLPFAIDSESTDDVQNPSSDQVHTKKQSNESAMTKLLDIAPTVNDSEAEIDSPLLEMQVGRQKEEIDAFEASACSARPEFK
jgi:hypothetical protein